MIHVKKNYLLDDITIKLENYINFYFVKPF